MLDVETSYYTNLLHRHLDGCGYTVVVDYDKLYSDFKTFILEHDVDSQFLETTLFDWADIICAHCPYSMIDEYCDRLNTQQHPGIYMATIILPHVKNELLDIFERRYSVPVDDITPEMWGYASKE